MTSEIDEAEPAAEACSDGTPNRLNNELVELVKEDGDVAPWLLALSLLFPSLPKFENNPTSSAVIVSVLEDKLCALEKECEPNVAAGGGKVVSCRSGHDRACIASTDAMVRSVANVSSCAALVHCEA